VPGFHSQRVRVGDSFFDIDRWRAALSADVSASARVVRHADRASSRAV
jgi:hypothetical protein